MLLSAGATCGSILVIAGLSYWFLHQSVGRELEAFVREELGEVRAAYSASSREPDSFRLLAADLAESHPANPLAWRVWESDGTLWLEYGRRDLLGALPAQPGTLGLVLRVSRDRLIGAEALGDGRVAGLVVDASAQTTMLRRYGAFSLALIVLTSLGATFLAAVLSRKISGMLRRVAHGARSIRHLPDSMALDQEGLPEEIRDVADALSEVLGQIQGDLERAQLMTSGLAHELRSPIQNLLGETEVALMRHREPEEYRRVLDSQIEDLHDLARAVDNLVTLCSCRDSGDQRELFDLGSEATMRLVREGEQATRRGVHLVVECTGELQVYADREALLLAIRNLVSNAVQWTREGGVVNVSIEGSPKEIAIRVRDEGPGIPVEVRAMVFEPFQRGPTANGRRAGYGLGLALARTAVEIHGGKIEIGDAPGGGALLSCRIPRPTGPPNPAGNDAPAASRT